MTKIKGIDGKACWDGYRYTGTENGKDNCVKVDESIIYYNDSLRLEIIEHQEPVLYQEAEYQGRKVKLGKPTRGDSKKFKVYVKKNNPGARKSFRARHNCDNPGPRTKARYWSCRKW